MRTTASSLTCVLFISFIAFVTLLAIASTLLQATDTPPSLDSSTNKQQHTSTKHSRHKQRDNPRSKVLSTDETATSNTPDLDQGFVENLHNSPPQRHNGEDSNSKSARPDVSIVQGKAPELNSIFELQERFNRRLSINPNNDTRAFAAFVSVSIDERKALDYLVGFLTLFASVKANTKTNYPFIVTVVPPRENLKKGITAGKVVAMTLQLLRQLEESMSVEDRNRIRVYIAPYINNPTGGKHSSSNNVESRYIDTFNKLHMWRLDEFGFEKIIYFDADVIVMKQDIDLLFKCGHFCAVSDLCLPEFFNGGLMVLEPSNIVYKDMMDKMSQPKYLSYDGGEQGFINRYFEFNTNSSYWPLTELPQQQVFSSENDHSEESIPKRVYRLPFHFNNQVQLLYSSYAGWKKFENKFVASHITMPLKPWAFISFPILDVGYVWYPYFQQISLYSIFPVHLLAGLVVSVLLSFLLLGQCSKLLETPVEKSIFGIKWMYPLLQQRLEMCHNIQRLDETWFEWMASYLLFEVTPLSLVFVTCLGVVYLFTEVLLVQTFDPHIIWFIMLGYMITGSILMLGSYSIFLAFQSGCMIHTLNPNETLYLKERIVLYQGINYAVGVMCSIGNLLFGFLLVLLITWMTFGNIVLHITCFVLYSMSNLYLAYWCVKKTPNKILMSVLENTKPSCEGKV